MFRSQAALSLFGFNLTIEVMGRKRVREEREKDRDGKTVSERHTEGGWGGWVKE